MADDSRFFYSFFAGNNRHKFVLQIRSKKMSLNYSAHEIKHLIRLQSSNLPKTGSKILHSGAHVMANPLW
jgi:hypothetical protein